MVTGGFLDTNPATSVKGPALVMTCGKTPVLAAEEVRELLDSISLTRIGAALALKVQDVTRRNHRLRVRLSEKGGKVHDVPCHHILDAYLSAYLETKGQTGRPTAPLFPSITAYLESGGVLEKAAVMAAHASTRTTPLYGRRDDKLTLDEFEKIQI